MDKRLRSVAQVTMEIRASVIEKTTLLMVLGARATKDRCMFIDFCGTDAQSFAQPLPQTASGSACQRLAGLGRNISSMVGPPLRCILAVL
jgi:hypothetical protein